MRRPALLLALLVPLLLAGCTEIQAAREDAQRGLDEAREAMETAQREAQEARDRYDRVKSAVVVREERVHLSLIARWEIPAQPEWTNGTASFSVHNATRSDGTQVPAENITRLPPLVIAVGDALVTCDPLTCRIEVEADATYELWFEDAPDRRWTRTAGAVEPPIELPDARVLATTALGDADA